MTQSILIKTCVECGKEYLAAVHNQKYCSRKCQKEPGRRANNKNFGEGECVQCGKVFKRFKANHVYCSKRCGVKNRYAYKRVAYELKKCEVCEGVFKPLTITQKYCTVKCRLKFNKEKHLDTAEKYHRLRFELFKRDGFKCVYCGRSAKETILEIDHLHPKSRGGLDVTENYVTACRACNSGKTDSLLSESDYSAHYERINCSDMKCLE